MADLFELVQPRDDVLAGELSDDVFAASLDDVAAGTGAATYRDAAVYWETTYPSAGLKSLLDESLGRVGGGRPNAAPVIRIETNLGGGKTHNLIGLYHAAKGALDPLRAMEFMDAGMLPKDPVEHVAVFIGDAYGATSFPEVDGIKPNTMWGFLALQLGGAEAYELVRQDDEALTAAGADAFKQIIGDGPALVLIDEIARYLTAADGRVVGKGTLANQTTAFLMSLMTAVGASPNASLVLTTTQVTDAFGEQTTQVLDAIAEAQSLIARKEHVLRPSEEADLPRILARRLFAAVDGQAGARVAQEYASAIADAFSKGADLPERMTGPGFVTDVSRTYPFHPDVVTVLDKRLSTIPNFQRTRGALRLLARTVRILWADKPAGTQLLHLHHIDLADKDTAEELSSRLDKASFEPVIRADIASQAGGEPSHAEDVDHKMGTPFARRIATTAYLYSLTRDVPGVPAATLMGSVLAPGDDANVIAKALDNLETTAWYLHTDTRGFRFATEASLAKLIQQAEMEITPGKAKQAATDIYANQYKDSALKIRRTWEDAKVPDRDDDAWLVLLHWDEFGHDNGVADPSVIPTQVQTLWEKTPAGGVREYRNRLVFLVPQSSGHEAMIRAVRRHLALKALASNTETLSSLPEEKRKEVADRAKASELEARVAVCNHVDLLYVPQQGGLEAVELDVVTNASVKQNQADAVLDRLAAMEKTLAAGDKPLDPGWIKSKLGTQLDSALSTLELVRAFARRPDLKLVLDRAQVSALVTAGVRNGVWEYQDSERGDDGWSTKERPSAAVRLADDTYLYPLGSAPAPKPVGGNLDDLLPPAPGGGSPGGGGGPTPGAGPATFPASGKADVAIASARQAAVDAGRAELREFRVAIDELSKEAGTQLAKLLTVVPAGQQGATVSYAISVNLDFGEGNSLRFEFHGLPTDYAPLKSGLDHSLRQHDASVKASLAARFDPPLPLSGQEVEDLVGRARDTGPAKCSITVSTEAD
jgi:hypothetical protein